MTSVSDTSGRLRWIGLRPASAAPMHQVEAVHCDPEQGLVGDRYGKPHGDRQVTIIQFEHLAELGQRLNRTVTTAELLRRNLAITGIPIAELIHREFLIGTVRFFGTGPCPPCQRMNETLGSGGLDAMQGLGGITARILDAGTIRVGESVRPVDDELAPSGRLRS